MKQVLFSFLSCSLLIILGCEQPATTESLNTFNTWLKDSPSINGKKDYLSSPFVTAGDRVYLVGHQDGSFPELGWHIKGEMGGIWDHPIKLMDGFSINLKVGNDEMTLNEASSFINYPFANQHIFEFPTSGLSIERWQFVPDGKEGLVVQLLVKNTINDAQSVDIQFVGRSDLRPTWLGERTQMIDGQDQANFLPAEDAWMLKDSLNPWFVMFGADLPPTSYQEVANTYNGNGLANGLTYSIVIPAGEQEQLNFTVAGSYQSKQACVENYLDIKSNWQADLLQKRDRYARLGNQTKLTIPDKNLEQTFEWLKYNCDWLVRTVPEIGTGIGAGIPDYPWWFGVDSEYALQGYMAIGQEDIVYKTIALLDSVSNAVNGNGRIIHEMSTNGAVFNPGNINETPQFASLIWEIYQWNGDRAFLERYFPTIEKGLTWLMEEKDQDKNLFPDGFGMMEIHGLDSEMIDVASYTQQAFADAALIATILGKEELANSYIQTANQLKEKINQEFWSEEFNSFADFIGTDEQALHLIEDAIVRADTLNKPWAVEELKATKAAIQANPSSEPRPFVLHHNWVVNTPMEMGFADSDKAIKGLKTAEQFVNPFGVFVTGIDRDESAVSDDGSFKGSKIFSYTGAVMTLPTGVLAVAENHYGRPNQSLNYLNRMARTFSYALPGSMYEVSPDYGMITQAWNIYSFAFPIVRQFFGIQPEAAQKTIIIQPQMPDAWDNAALENVKIGDNQISVFYEKVDGKTTIRATQTQADWVLQIRLPLAQTFKAKQGNVKEVGNTLVFVAEKGTVEAEIE